MVYIYIGQIFETNGLIFETKLSLKIDSNLCNFLCIKNQKSLFNSDFNTEKI